MWCEGARVRPRPWGGIWCSLSGPGKLPFPEKVMARQSYWGVRTRMSQERKRQIHGGLGEELVGRAACDWGGQSVGLGGGRCSQRSLKSWERTTRSGATRVCQSV